LSEKEVSVRWPWEQGGRQPILADESPLTIVELCDRYLRFATSYYRAADAKNQNVPVIRRAIRYLRELHGRLNAKDFGPLSLRAVRQRMIEDGLSRGYINSLVGRIVGMFRWAVAEELVSADVHRALAAVGGLRYGRSDARETEQVPPVDDATVDATLPYLPEVVADMVRLQRLTGCRPGELCAMRPSDLVRSGDVWEYHPVEHKTKYRGKNRVVFIGPQAQTLLLRYLARNPESNCFRPCDSEAKRLAAVHAARVTPLSCGNLPGTNRRRRPKRMAGESYSVDSYRQAIRRAFDKAFLPPGELAQRPGETAKNWRSRLSDQQRSELKEWQSEHRWSPNQLRHSAATDIRKRFGLEAAQVVLGHRAADVTQIYAERDNTLAANVARQVG